jgi:gluconate 5-dehydrogenase
MQPPSFNLSGRRALVTGSSQGIGLALAGALAAAGAHVILNGRDAAKLAAAAASLRAAGLANVATAAFDVTDEAAVQAASAGLGAVDILVNNTGIHRRGPLETMPLADWEAVLKTNLTSAFLVARAVAPGMISRRSGKIINVCSLMSELARPTTGSYAAAKGGLKMLTRAMCAEWAKHNLQVNGLAPGYILTDLTQSLASDPKFDAWIKGRTPAGRWGSADDLTGACVFLASPAADFINGQILTVDGGLSAVI